MAYMGAVRLFLPTSYLKKVGDLSVPFFSNSNISFHYRFVVPLAVQPSQKLMRLLYLVAVTSMYL